MKSGELSVFELEPFEATIEAVFAAEGFDATTIIAADHGEFVAAEVGAVFVDE